MSRTITIDEQLALAMSTGARAIENNKRLNGTTYVYDVFGEHPKEITYYDAAKRLREIAEPILHKEAWENGTTDILE